ncbi:MAG: ATP phosphoribosyltransferase regulatory subunit [Peptococcia bacterium]
MAAANLRIPSGMRDWLNGEAEDKRRLTNNLLDSIRSWGYQEISTPILEYYQVLLEGENDQEQDQLYKLIDRDGSILALRPEMTTPIARVVSSKIQGNPPWRLMYGGEVFRYENIQTGKQREFSQVGVEMIGQKGAEVDAEILALACETLQQSGLERFTVSLGHTGVLAGILQGFVGEVGEIVNVAEARNLILEKDFVGLEQLLEKTGLAKETIAGIISLLTEPQDNLLDLAAESDLPPAIKEALAELGQIMNLVKEYGFSEDIQVDLSTLRPQSYYTGMVFEIYTPGIGYTIGGGGRYDQLLHRFGKDYPATGFALGVERILLALPSKDKVLNRVLVAGDLEQITSQQIIKKADELRKEGRVVIQDFRKLSQDEAAGIAREKQAELCWLGGI